MCIEPGSEFQAASRLGRCVNDLRVIDQAGVALVPGESFGAPGFLRLSYALGEKEIERGVARISVPYLGFKPGGNARGERSIFQMPQRGE